MSFPYPHLLHPPCHPVPTYQVPGVLDLHAPSCSGPFSLCSLALSEDGCLWTPLRSAASLSCAFLAPIFDTPTCLTWTTLIFLKHSSNCAPLPTEKVPMLRPLSTSSAPSSMTLDFVRLKLNRTCGALLGTKTFPCPLFLGRPSLSSKGKI